MQIRPHLRHLLGDDLLHAGQLLGLQRRREARHLEGVQLRVAERAVLWNPAITTIQSLKPRSQSTAIECTAAFPRWHTEQPRLHPWHAVTPSTAKASAELRIAQHAALPRARSAGHFSCANTTC